MKIGLTNLDGKWPFANSDSEAQEEFVSINTKAADLVEKSLAREMNAAIDGELRELRQRRAHIVNAFLATLLDRGCNFPVAGEPLTALELTDRYITVSCMGGSVNTNLRVGTFKAVILIHDPRDGMDHEVMGIFQNYACHPDQTPRNGRRCRPSTLHSTSKLMV